MDREQWKAHIRNGIHSRFDESELRSLAFEFDINPGDLPGRTHTERVESLISYMERHRRLPDLIDKLRDKRPHENWPDIPVPPPSLIGETRTEKLQQKSKGFLEQHSIKIVIAVISVAIIVAIFTVINSSQDDDNYTPEEITQTAEVLTQTEVAQIPETPSPTPTPALTSTSIPTPTNTLIPTHTSTSTSTPTNTPTSTPTPLPTDMPTSTPVFTPTPLPEPTITSPPTLAPTVESSPSIYAISRASDECQVFYRQYKDHKNVSPPDLASYSISSDFDYGLVFTTTVASSQVYGLLICHFDLAGSGNEAEISFDDGSFELTNQENQIYCDEKKTLMLLRAYPGYQEIEEGTDTTNAPTGNLPFHDTPNPAGNPPFQTCSSNNNMYKFTVPDDRIVTIVVILADGWANLAVTARLSNFKLEVIE